MDEKFQPPCTINPENLKLVTDPSEKIGQLFETHIPDRSVCLRRISRIRTIQGSLAIKGNRLSEDQITAILDGKRVFAPSLEIQETINTFTLYDRLDFRRF